MRIYKHLVHLLLVVLLALSASTTVSAKVASGPQNLASTGRQAETVFNLLTCQGKTESSSTAAPGCSVVPNSAKGLIGKDFEDYLAKSLGGRGSFKVNGREFDGAVGSRWYEAKSGRYWEDHAQLGKGFDKFKSDIGARRAIAKQNGATYEVHSNTPIPSHVKDWLSKKGIPFTEH